MADNPDECAESNERGGLCNIKPVHITASHKRMIELVPGSVHYEVGGPPEKAALAMEQAQQTAL
jgi:hypothetical protein